MDFERDFKIIAKKLVSVPDGIDYALGSGNFGKAYLVKEKNGPWKNRWDFETWIKQSFHESVRSVVKRIFLKNSKMAKKALEEVAVMKSLKHSNIVR